MSAQEVKDKIKKTFSAVNKWLDKWGRKLVIILFIIYFFLGIVEMRLSGFSWSQIWQMSWSLPLPPIEIVIGIIVWVVSTLIFSVMIILKIKSWISEKTQQTVLSLITVISLTIFSLLGLSLYL